MSFLSKLFNTSRFKDLESLFAYIYEGLTPLVNEWIKEFKNQNKEHLIIDYILHRHTQWHINAFIFDIVEYNNTSMPKTTGSRHEMQQNFVKVWSSLFSNILPVETDLFELLADIKIGLMDDKYFDGGLKSEYSEYTSMVHQASKIYWEMGDPNSNYFGSYTYDTMKMLIKGEIKPVDGGYRSFLKPNLAKIFLKEAGDQVNVMLDNIFYIIRNFNRDNRDKAELIKRDEEIDSYLNGDWGGTCHICYFGPRDCPHHIEIILDDAEKPSFDFWKDGHILFFFIKRRLEIIKEEQNPDKDKYSKLQKYVWGRYTRLLKKLTELSDH